MDPNSDDKPRRWTDHTRRAAASTKSIAALARQSFILNNAKHNKFDNCQFVVNAGIGPGLDALHKCIAPNAILNAGGRADVVKCHPGTREEVIDRVEKWKNDARDGVTPNRIFWLSGPAGAGKTAIVQTVAETWQSDGIHAANFFFYRTDASRNHPRPLVSTLLYQIFEFYPNTREAVEAVLASKPRIFEASMKEQFDQLICAPLLSIGAEFLQPIFLLIDGLDECDLEEKRFQAQILQALDALVSLNDSPFFVLVGSRVEHQISVAFKEIRATVEAIFLDDQYSPEKDIRLFVSAEFDRIKRTHPLAPQDEDWPSIWDFNGIVKRSSGQFIYAATVMRFILLSPSDPKLSLARVQGAARIPTKSPFAHLDAMYTYILSQAEDQEALKDILGAYTVCRSIGFVMQIAMLQMVLRPYNSNYSDDDIRSCLASITTIARLVDGQLSFYHSSLDDYLTTLSRSGQYFCDVDAYIIKILPTLCKTNYHKWNHAPFDNILAIKCVDILLRRRQLSPTVWSGLLSIDPSNDPTCVLPIRMKQIYNYCVSDDDVAKYKQILREWIDHCLFVQPSPVLLYRNLNSLPHVEDLLETAEVDHLGDVPGIVTENFLEDPSWIREARVGLDWYLKDIYKRHYPHRLETYKRLMSQWTAWAVANKLTLHAPEIDLPFTKQYYQEAVMAQRGHGTGLA